MGTEVGACIGVTLRGMGVFGSKSVYVGREFLRSLSLRAGTGQSRTEDVSKSSISASSLRARVIPALLHFRHLHSSNKKDATVDWRELTGYPSMIREGGRRRDRSRSVRAGETETVEVLVSGSRGEGRFICLWRGLGQGAVLGGKASEGIVDILRRGLNSDLIPEKRPNSMKEWSFSVEEELRGVDDDVSEGFGPEAFLSFILPARFENLYLEGILGTPRELKSKQVGC